MEPAALQAGFKLPEMPGTCSGAAVPLRRWLGSGCQGNTVPVWALSGAAPPSPHQRASWAARTLPPHASAGAALLIHPCLTGTGWRRCCAYMLVRGKTPTKQFIVFYQLVCTKPYKRRKECHLNVTCMYPLQMKDRIFFSQSKNWIGCYASERNKTYTFS